MQAVCRTLLVYIPLAVCPAAYPKNDVTFLIESHIEFPYILVFLRPFLPFSAPSALTLLSLAIGQLVSPSSTH